MYILLRIPRPCKIIKRPPAAKESVQPGQGSEYEAYIIAGLKIQTGTSPLFF